MRRRSGAVSKSAELAHRPRGTFAIGGQFFRGRHAQFQGVHRKLGFDFEASRHRGKGFDVTARKNLVSRQHIGELPAEDIAHHGGQDIIAEAMASSVSLHAPRHARSIDEVEIFFDHPADHARSGFGFVGRIAIHQHINVGVDVGEHAPDHVSLALAGLAANNRARGFGDVNGAIGRVVVVDVDCRRGQRLTKSRDSPSNGQFFVEARDEHGDVLLASVFNPGLRVPYDCRRVQSVSPRNVVSRPLSRPGRRPGGSDWSPQIRPKGSGEG